MAFWTWLRAIGGDNAEVRSEIWRLGNRYQGRPLEGAREELKAPGLAPKRVQLLRACVRRLKTP